MRNIRLPAPPLASQAPLPVTDKPIPLHFDYCPRCGSGALRHAEGRANSVHCGACDFTLFFNPTSSAGALIFDERGHLLVIERAKDPRKGKYGIPGGFTDFGERLEEVVVREAKEEVNLDLQTFAFFASFPNQYHYKSIIYPVIDSYFIATVSSFESMAAEAAEVAGIRFVDPSAVPEDQWAFPSLRNAVQLYLERTRKTP